MKKKKLYPLKFIPIPSVHPWGEESWKVLSLGPVSSVVSEGFLTDNSLDDILETYMGDLMGDELFDYYNMFFPIIVKTANMKGTSSLQVHPDDEVGLERYDCCGKTKLWYVIDASENAVVYMGFNRRVSAAEFYTKCQDGSVTEVLNAIRPRRGDAFLVEPGTVHAACGVRLAEVQEASDLSFRLYDWGRENDPSTKREINLEEAIDIINYEQYDGSGFSSYKKGVANIVTDSHFAVNSVNLDKSYQVDISKFDSCIIYLCTAGSFTLVTDEGYEYETICDETILVPSNFVDFELRPESPGTHVLEISIPKPLETEDNYLKKQ